MPDNGSKIINLSNSTKPQRAPVTVASGADVAVEVETLFHLEDGSEVEPAEPGQPQELAPGTTYLVTVVLRAAGKDVPKVGDGMEIVLVCKFDDGRRLEIPREPDPVRTALLEEKIPVRRDFLLKIPEGSPNASGRLVVRAQGAQREARDLRERPVEIVGKIHAPEKGFAEDVQIPLDSPPNPKLAILYVQEDKRQDREQILVSGYHPFRRFTKPFKKLKVSLADADINPSIEVFTTVETYSIASIREVLQWFDEVIESTGGDVSIVIVEHVESRVPWEMLVVESGTPPLGARVMVTRWAKVVLKKDDIPLRLDDQCERVGSVLNFVDAERLQHSKSEVDQLSQCAGIACKKLDDLKKLIRRPPADTALLFLSCHGTFAKDRQHQVQLEENNLKGKRGLTVLDLVGFDPPQKRPAVVVNACHSARNAYNDYGLSGLPLFFLATFGSSYLGTLGAVNEKYAAELGSELIRKAASPDGVDLAKFIFEKRVEAWKKFDPDGDAEHYWSYVSAFMYVLYGPPQNQMRLLARKADGE